MKFVFIDAEKGEYAGALELKIFAFSIKAIALVTTKRPDGSEGWSLLIFVFGQFRVHIAFGIFWTGEGLGADWPGADFALLGLLAVLAGFSALAVRAKRDTLAGAAK